MKPVMLGIFGPVVEADGFAQRRSQVAEFMADGRGGEDSFAVDLVLNDAEAGRSLVQDK
ncbi:hypothetical protein NP284_42340 [Rhodopseudomonas pseudopalustris]|uniref:hypothetical protein n=1 Tax=Rhodopseudomonas pseudopalustris TaxID=1513892 RepID=UPI001588269D|nr:hypothetical protein [Rhodopseudomonas pseudopalustris]